MPDRRSTPADRARRWLALAPVAAALAAAALPTPAVLDGGDAGLARLLTVVAAAVVTGGAGALLAIVARPRQRRVALAVAALALVAGGVAALEASRAGQRCSARYDGRRVLIGTELTPLAQSFLDARPGLTADDLVLDAAGVPAVVWTPESIARCRRVVMATHIAWWPLLSTALVGLVMAIAAGRSLTLAAPPPRQTAPGRPGEPSLPAAASSPRYDVFVSYRHGPPDAAAARALADALEAEGYAVAIDGRDFAPQDHFLTEMERCIRQSRFTLALISERYLHSGPCNEEALIGRVLDFDERRHRLIPLYLEPVEAPAWLRGLSGIDLRERDPLVDPLARLLQALGPPLDAAPTTPSDADR